MPDIEPTIISADEVETKYRISSDVEYPYLEFADDQEQHLYAGGLRIAGDFESADGVDWNPFNVVVDGDLVVDGTIDWADYGSGCYVLVTGNVSCKNLLLQGCPTFVVRGDLVVDNAIQGHHGDDGGFLVVRGKTKARLIVNTLYFNMALGTAPDALVCSDEGRIDCPVDFGDDELAGVFLPELLDDSGIDERKLAKALRDGRAVLPQL